MVIGVDAGALSITDDRLKVGVYRVSREALRALVRVDTQNEYRLYSFGRGIGEIGPTSPRLRGVKEIGGGMVKEVRLPRRGWGRFWLPFHLRMFPVDVFLGLTQALPSSITSYNIGFIYDLGFVYRPEVYGAAARTLKKQTDDLVRRADHIITVSHAAMADIVKEYGVPRGSVTVAYPGVGPLFSPAGEKYIRERPYFLFVGSLNKAKDIPTLIEMYAQWGDTQHDLYLIGGDYWPDPNITETLERFHLDDRVKRLGFVPDEALPKYYRGATAFVTTAIREGFCLPAAEALACGTPVVAFDRGALGEVVGDGGIIISEKSKVKSVKLEFIKAMEKMTDRKIRDTYSKKAIVRGKRFRWETFAKQVMEQIANYTRPPLAKAKGVAL